MNQAAQSAKWSKGLHLRHDGLRGWHDIQTADERHRHLEKAAARDGWGTVRHRLEAIANLTSRSNPELHKIAEEDLRWIAIHRRE